MIPAGSGPRVVVVGGGVIGVSCAYFLSRAGASVALLERGRIAGEASFGNAGTVSAGHPPLNRPGRVREGLGRMFDPASPLYVPPRWDPDLWRWLATFARHCTHEAVARSMEVMAPMGHRTLALFERIVAEEGMACGYRPEGYYDVCATEDGFDAACREADLIRSHGYTPEALGPEELRRREPALAPDVVGGVFYPEAATVDPLAFTRELAAAAVRQGTVVREGVGVMDVSVRGGQVAGVALTDGAFEPADAVVLATGPFSLALAGRVGVRLPVQPGKGYHRDIPVGVGGAPDLGIACVLHESSVFCTPLEGRVRLAGTMEFSGWNDTLRPERLEQLSRSARRAFPAFGRAAPVSEWAGLRPVSADGLPFVGPLPEMPGVWIATGHGMLGLTLGPVTGELVARGVVAREPVPESLAPTRDRLHS